MSADGDRENWGTEVEPDPRALEDRYAPLDGWVVGGAGHDIEEGWPPVPPEVRAILEAWRAGSDEQPWHDARQETTATSSTTTTNSKEN